MRDNGLDLKHSDVSLVEKRVHILILGFLNIHAKISGVTTKKTDMGNITSKLRDEKNKRENNHSCKI